MHPHSAEVLARALRQERFEQAEAWRRAHPRHGSAQSSSRTQEGPPRQGPSRVRVGLTLLGTAAVTISFVALVSG